MVRRIRSISDCDPATTPATVSLWPPMYLDAECTTRSTPSVTGCWNTGVAQELSINVVTPCCLARAASAPTSWASIIQLFGLSM